MLSDEQIIDELRRAMAAETSGIDPQPGLLDRVREDLDASPVTARPRRRLGVRFDVIVATLAVAVAIAVIAVLFLHHNRGASQTPATSTVRVGTERIAAQAPDPDGGLPWAIRTDQVLRLYSCVQIGRLLGGRIGTLVAAGGGTSGPLVPAGGSGRRERFVAIPLHDNFPCNKTDAVGNQFLNVLEQGQSAGDTGGTRNIEFGVLGPDAVSVTYVLHGRTVTEPTGPDGAYIAVVPGTAWLCRFIRAGAKLCGGGSGGSETTTPTLQSGIITSVRYRDGRVCRLKTLATPTVGQPFCPNVGYVHYPPFHSHVTEAQVRAPMTVRIITAKQFCYRLLAFGSFQLACGHGIPRGAHPDTPGAAPSIALVNITFTARVAADNYTSVYEFSYGRASGPANCTTNTGGTAATTMLPIRAGQRVTIQDDQEVCPGTYAGLVTYQPNGRPGGDTLLWDRPIRDHSILVGRFDYTLR